jgi:solute carrier family 25 phosphate transporter 3
MSSTAQQAGAALDTVKQKVEAAAPAPVAPKKLSGIDLYSRFAFAGAVCCSVTHGGLTPVDV